VVFWKLFRCFARNILVNGIQMHTDGVTHV
jgi:hypothetical protein